MKYVTLPDDEKLELLNEHSIAGPWPSLDHTMWCLHCEKEFKGRDVRVWQSEDGRLWLECGTPECDGSPIDWADYPWWDEQHPLTLAHVQLESSAGGNGHGELDGEERDGEDEGGPALPF